MFMNFMVSFVSKLDTARDLLLKWSYIVPSTSAYILRFQYCGIQLNICIHEAGSFPNGKYTTHLVWVPTNWEVANQLGNTIITDSFHKRSWDAPDLTLAVS